MVGPSHPNSESNRGSPRLRAYTVVFTSNNLERLQVLAAHGSQSALFLIRGEAVRASCSIPRASYLPPSAKTLGQPLRTLRYLHIRTYSRGVTRPCQGGQPRYHRPHAALQAPCGRRLPSSAGISRRIQLEVEKCNSNMGVKRLKLLTTHICRLCRNIYHHFAQICSGAF